MVSKMGSGVGIQFRVVGFSPHCAKHQQTWSDGHGYTQVTRGAFHAFPQEPEQVSIYTASIYTHLCSTDLSSYHTLSPFELSTGWRRGRSQSLDGSLSHRALTDVSARKAVAATATVTAAALLWAHTASQRRPQESYSGHTLMIRKQ